MSNLNGLIKRLPVKFTPNPKRVICLPYNDKPSTIKRIFNLVNKLSESEVQSIEKRIIQEFEWRHRGFEEILAKRYSEIESKLPGGSSLSIQRENVLASYFIMEYSIEAAALFNPSIVLHPDQSGIENGEARFVMSLRGTGEGHISSLEFMTGNLKADGGLKLDARSSFATNPIEVSKNIGGCNTVVIEFNPETDLSERVIFPVSEDERNGIEDVRLVRFEEDGKSKYYGTFTAYDGRQIKSKLLETEDFLHFNIHTICGKAIEDKGMALFPRKINGKFAMISRQDGDNIRIMFSNDIRKWEKSDILLEPKWEWEFVKNGNIGSPLETEHGWLLLTHGVGAMRKYVIGACLLDLNNPTKVISELKEPLISPNENEREGYVPNVVYSCGGILHNGQVILPYAMSDSVSGFVTVNVDDLINHMKKC